MKKVVIISIALNVALLFNVLAQDSYHVQNAMQSLLFSQHYAGSTARSVGMSGAFGALGGDVSVLSTNPAGLAIYRSSEFTFTPTLNLSTTSAKYENEKPNYANNPRFIFNNAGYVYSKSMYNEKGLQSINFGIAYNRLSDFNRTVNINIPNAKSSLLDEFVFYANDYGNSEIPFEINELHDHYERTAFEAWAIYFGGDNDEYYSFFTDLGYNQPLKRETTTRGGIGEYDFSIGFNFNNNLYFGATLGVQSVFYHETVYHTEEPDFHYMYSFTFKDENQTEGTGVNFKTGIIWRPVQMLRLGAAVHTPTHLWIRQVYGTSMRTVWNRIPPPDMNIIDFYDFDYWETEDSYRITTPWRYLFNAASIIGRFGLVGFDVEVVDYSKSKIAPRPDFKGSNDTISKYYTRSVNLKGGAEFRLGPIHLRGGIAYYGNPYNKSLSQFKGDKNIQNAHSLSFSGGIGFRKRDFFMDAAYSFTKHPKMNNQMYLTYNDDYFWYEYADLQTNVSKILVTFGFRF